MSHDHEEEVDTPEEEISGEEEGVEEEAKVDKTGSPILALPEGLILSTPGELSDEWGFDCLVYGNPGIGKTTFCASAQDHPRGKDCLVIDAEGGTRSIADRSDIKIFNPTTVRDEDGDIVESAWEQIFRMYQFLAHGEHPFRTLIMDSLTAVQEMALEDVMRSSKTPNLPNLGDWGKTNSAMQKMVKAWRNFARDRGWNVLFTALVTEKKDESTGAIVGRAKMTPGCAEMVLGLMDCVGFLDIGDKSGKRVLHFAQKGVNIAKVRQPMKGTKERPILPGQLDNPTMGKILDIIYRKDD